MAENFFDEPTVNDASDAVETAVATESQKCPNCGNNLKFDPERRKLYCEYCGTEVAIAENANYQEIDITQGFDTHEQWDNDVKVFRCENCGAKVVLDKNATADVCPFCGTSYVVPIEEQAGIKPNVVVPFALGKDEALERVKTWAKKSLFAPKAFKKNLKAEKLKGVYMPCYTFDSQTFSTYDGRIGIHHTRTVGSGKNRRTETWTEWRHISGRFNRFFNDIIVSSVNKLDQRSLERLGDFPAEANRVYEDKFLYGFMSYGSERPITDCWTDAKSIIDGVLEREILNQYRHDVVAYLNVSTSHAAVTYKLELLPVYVGNFVFNKKPYNFLINGLSGKIVGKLPKSPLKVSIAVLLGIAAVVGFVFLLAETGTLDGCSQMLLAAL